MRTGTRAVAACALVLVLAVLGSPARAAKYQIHFLIGHRSLDYFQDAAVDFKKTVEAESHGDIEVVLVEPGSNDNKEKADASIPAAVASGAAEMGHSYADVVGALDPQLCAFEAPYLIRDYRHMEGVFEGPLGSQLLAQLKTAHLVGLSFTYSGGSSGVATVDRELRRPEDLKGLRVGVYGDAVDTAWLQALGAVPVPIRHDLPSLLPLARSGGIDAVVTTWRNFEVAGLDGAFRYFNMPGSTYLVSVSYVNDKFFAGLPKEYQDLLMRASHDLGRVERQRTIQLDELARGAMTAKGVWPVYLNPRDAQRFARAVAPAYPAIAREVGAGLIDQIRRAPDGPDFPPSTNQLAGR